MTEALQTVQFMKKDKVVPDVVTYNTLIDGFASATHLGKKEIQSNMNTLLREMEASGVKPNVITATSCIEVCTMCGDLDGAQRYFQNMKRWGLEPDEKTYGSLVKSHEKLEDRTDKKAYMKSCQDLIEEMETTGLTADRECYTSLISACANVRDLDAAFTIWNTVRQRNFQPDVCLFGAMIKACLSVEDLDKADQFLQQMKTEGIEPSPIIFSTFFNYFHQKNMESHAEELYQKVKQLGIELHPQLRTIIKKFNLT